MQKRKPGKSSLKVSALRLGCTDMTFGYGPAGDKLEMISPLHSAVERGFSVTLMRLFAAIAISLSLLASASAQTNAQTNQAGAASGTGTASSASAHDSQAIKITRSGSQPHQQAPAENFTGSVSVEPLSQANAPARASAPKAIEARLADYLEMPITGKRAGNTPFQVARVNFLIEEPGAARLFISDQNGTLYIVDKKTQKPVSYINLNGSDGESGLFLKFNVEYSYASGLLGFTFDPDYRRNGIFYTIHLEVPAVNAPATPKSGVLSGLDASRFAPTKAILTPSGGRSLTRDAVVIEWTDKNIRNATFEGTAREVMRVQLLSSVHPMNDLTFNPTARRGDPDWRVLYISTGDGGTGETNIVNRLNPQRLDHFGGKIIRIVPDLREHVSTSQVSENGQYRIPNDNPFVATPGARKEIWANGMRNPHRMAWDKANLLAFNIGSNGGSPVRYETIAIIRRGANYGYPMREGPETKPLNPMDDRIGADNTLPLRISDTVVLNERTPIQDMALAYKTGVEGRGIANGFVYRGKKWPALQGTVVFADITSGKILYAKMADLIAATDGNPSTTAAYTEIKTELGRLVVEKFPARTKLPAPTLGPPGERGFRVDVRLATDEAGEIYILTKSDGMIRRVVSIQ